MHEDPLTLEVQFKIADETGASLGASVEYASSRVMTDPAMLPHVGDTVVLSDREGDHGWLVERREFHFNRGCLIIRVYLAPKTSE